MSKAGDHTPDSFNQTGKVCFFLTILGKFGFMALTEDLKIIIIIIFGAGF